MKGGTKHQPFATMNHDGSATRRAHNFIFADHFS